jgi:nucleoid DNA-binding protein
MNPKKPKDFIKPTAEALGHSETLVDDVTGFYWSYVRKALSELEGPSITVTNLGTFKVRYKKIQALEKKHQIYLDNLEADNMTFNKHTLQNISKKKLEGLDKIRKQMEEEFQRKKEVRTKRKIYIDEKNLEE